MTLRSSLFFHLITYMITIVHSSTGGRGYLPSFILLWVSVSWRFCRAFSSVESQWPTPSLCPRCRLFCVATRNVLTGKFISISLQLNSSQKASDILNGVKVTLCMHTLYAPRVESGVQKKKVIAYLSSVFLSCSLLLLMFYYHHTDWGGQKFH